MSVVAALPIITILVLMLALRWSAAAAGVAGLVVAVLVASTGFDYFASFPFGVTAAVSGLAAEAGFLAVTILWIIGPALGIHHLQVRCGATEILRQAMERLAPDPRILALLVGWFFALFLEGAAGFGTSVALAAPFLVSAGFNARTAVVMPMIGHCIGVSFGAVGTPVLAQVAITSMDGLDLSRSTGLYHLLLGALLLVVAMRFVIREYAAAGAAASTWRWTAFAAVCFVVPFAVLSQFVGPELPTLGGALFGTATFIAALVFVGRQRLAHGERVVALPVGRLLAAAAPYLLLTGLVLVTRMVGPLRQILLDVEVGWRLPGGFAGSVAPLYHPGTLLLASFLGAALIQRIRLCDVQGAFIETTRALLPVTVALGAMLGLSRLMVHAAMIDELAAAAARWAGPAWPVVASFVGVLGTFVTGSATASNILFTDFQHATATRLGLPATPLVGVQGFGAAIGNAVCPHNIVAASATVSLTGKEGEVLRRTLPVVLGYALLGGLVAVVLVR